MMATVSEMNYENTVDTRPKLAISFSGGRTSAYMTKMLIEEYGATHNIAVMFANTGCEHPETLRFINDCDINWGFNTIWLEGYANEAKGVGMESKIVTYETASQDGAPYESVIKKYGIMNMARPACSSFLKRDTINHFMKKIGFKHGPNGNCKMAIGIRADEMDRMSSQQRNSHVIYPLVEKGITKQDVIDYMKKFPWDLKIPSYLGNCTWCWKKSHRTLLTVAAEQPEAFDFPRKMEQLYGRKDYGHKTKTHRTDGLNTFFRKQINCDELMEEAKAGDFIKISDPNFNYERDFDVKMDKQSSCGESCELYADE